MGAKAWSIAYFDGNPKAVLATRPALDREAATELARHLFPTAELEAGEDWPLAYLNPDPGDVRVGAYGDLKIVAYDELAGDYPSKVDARWLDASLGRHAYLHATHSVVDWFAFGLWQDGRLIRALSVSPDNGVIESIGAPLAFERPYWDGAHPVEAFGDDPYPLPFHPLELAEASLLHHLGFQFEGRPRDWVVGPEDVSLASFKIKNRRPRWKFW